jgi:hypothetical protein
MIPDGGGATEHDDASSCRGQTVSFLRQCTTVSRHGVVQRTTMYRCGEYSVPIGGIQCTGGWNTVYRCSGLLCDAKKQNITVSRMSRRDNMLVATDNPHRRYRSGGTECVAGNPHSIPDGMGAGCESHHFYQYSVPYGTAAMVGCHLSNGTNIGGNHIHRKRVPLFSSPQG